MSPIVLWLAQGFYVGKIPVAPGTFGSILGLLWLGVLLGTNTVWGYGLGSLFGIMGSVWVCGKAERILGQTDPSSVVLDEIVAVPLCFAGWLSCVTSRTGEWPAPQSLLSGEAWLWTAGILAAFRFFDIVKPWPVRQSQNLPGGWGVTLDDVLAAVYVNLTFSIAWWLRGP